MTIHTITFVILTILSLAAAYLVGKPAPTSTDDLQQSEEVVEHASGEREPIA
jgi:hypothetical protein